MKATMCGIKFKKVCTLGVFTMFGFTLMAQNTIEQQTEKTEVKEAQEVPISTEEKYTPESFYVINDKPVSREEYMKHLDAKKEEDNISVPQ